MSEPPRESIPRRSRARWIRDVLGRNAKQLSFIPRERRFYDLFEQQATVIVRSAVLLEQALADAASLIRYQQEIKDLERQGDEITHEIVVTLNRTFVTPFDHEDIYALASGLDDILDYIEEVADTANLYGITTIPEPARELARLLSRAVGELEQAIGKLESGKGIEEHSAEVHRLEDGGDSVSRRAIAELFAGEHPLLEVIKLKELYGLLEDSLHRGVAMAMLIAVLFGAITWNLFTWRAGLPSSSSHALIGALIGMGLAVYGLDMVQWGEVYPVFIALVTSPVVGLLIAYVLTVVLLNLFRRVRPSHDNGVFRRLQLFSSGFVAFSHGANDAQKTMAIITLALFSSGHLPEFIVPTWVALAAAIAIGLGTWAGGWRIIRMEPVDGFAAQTAAAAVIQLATTWGLPVSTTQVVSGAVMGAGATRRFSAVRWGVARRIVWAWIFTIPASAVF